MLYLICYVSGLLTPFVLWGAYAIIRPSIGAIAKRIFGGDE